MVISLEQVLDKLRSMEWSGLGVGWVVLFGGVARRGIGRDLDLLVLSRNGSPMGLRMLLDLVVAVADRTGVEPDLVDIVDATRASCTVILDAWKHGKLVYEAEKGAARQWLLRKVLICNDYRLIAKKHRLTEKALESMIRRWGT